MKEQPLLHRHKLHTKIIQDEHLNDEKQFIFHENLLKDKPLTTFDGKRKKKNHGEEESIDEASGDGSREQGDEASGRRGQRE